MHRVSELTDRNSRSSLGSETGCRPGAARLQPFSRTTVLLLAVLFVLAVIPPLPASAFDPYTGKITAINSDETPPVIHIVRPGKTGLAQAKAGDAVFVGDTVKTGKNVRAQIALSDKSLVNIGPDSTFRVKAYTAAPAEAKRSCVFKALRGTIRFIVSKAFTVSGTGASGFWRETNIMVETPSAVAGVRGTDFVVVVDAAKSVPTSEIAVFDGVVTVQNIVLAVKEMVTLSANQITMVKRGLKPEKPSDLSKDRKEALTQATTPAASPLPQVSALPGAQAKRSEKYTADDIARDIAAGVPLPEVFDRAAAAGLPADVMVAGAIDAGVDPGTVVYTAVSEGYPARAVVEGAIGDGAPLYDVIAAALAGGADKKDVIAAATGEGEPTAAVASAVALAQSSDAPVYGAALLAGPPVEAIPPAAPVMIGGGGGVTPSTLPASPYKP